MNSCLALCCIQGADPNIPLPPAPPQFDSLLFDIGGSPVPVLAAAQDMQWGLLRCAVRTPQLAFSSL